MIPARLQLDLIPGEYAVCRLAPELPVPTWATTGPIWTVTRTDSELSIVCSAQQVPPGSRAEAGWRALRVAGPLDFGLTGILSALTAPLARAGVSVFAFSTFDTDYVLVRAAQLPTSLEALRGAGHTVRVGPG